MTMTRRLLVVEDDDLLAALLVEVLAENGFDIRRAATAVEARRIAAEFDPDAALVDVVLGSGPSGIDLAHVLAAEIHGIGIVFLSQYPDPAAAGVTVRDLPAGSGFLHKSRVHRVEYLLEGLDAVLSERPEEFRHDEDGDPALAALTPTQREVLRMMAQGYSNAEIAERRGATLSAVEQTISVVLRTLGIDRGGETNPRVEAVRRYIAAAGLPPRS